MWHWGAALGPWSRCGGCWNGLSKMSPVPVKHFVPFIAWTQLINAFVQLGDLQLSLAICNTLLCCSKQEWCPPPWSITLPPELSTPPSFRAPQLWLGGFWVVLASPALLPLALALVVLSHLGHSRGCPPSLAVLWASLVWINTHVLSTFSSLICSLKPESSGWLWTDMHMLWVLTHLLWATCFVPSLALKQQYHLHSFS